ncbi:YitT family protein [Aureibacillus halotolerans]|uniref:Uncharacterized membrane-anchored protein YitT (DUF2179 family) n=1 Tax=Aureibacillus halotolerans TaxID=1508390 RepID=A0A4R6U4P0_9BACI|nr:YitT family protein [Aureibacillus halotolerans]TDQ40676.1 uncharacterized membrane-anchored protein YitT (DUF2179 family) [Aureibacillus halotolerans]
MNTPNEAKSYALIALGTLLYGFSYNLFLLPALLAAGGISGISTLLFSVYGWTPALVQGLLNIPIFFLGYALLGKEFSIKTFVATFLLPFFIWLTSYVPLAVHDPMLSSIYGGILLGLALGLVFRGNGSTGGTTIIGQLIKKYTGFSSGFAQLLIDGVIVVFAMIVFDLERALYAMIAIFIGSKIIDLVQLRTSSSKLVLIVTEKEQQVTDLIRNELDRGFTKVWSEGGFSSERKALLFSVVEQSEAVYLKSLIQHSDTDSFVIFLNASDIVGRGFTLPKTYR